jgi:hypothetical protein
VDDPLKHWRLTLQDVLSQMIVIIIVISVKTANLTYVTLFYAHRPHFDLVRFLVTNGITDRGKYTSLYIPLQRSPEGSLWEVSPI